VSEKEAMELIDEYLDEVKRYLPEDIAEDVVAELRTHIIDKAMELGGLTVRNVYRVLRDLGDPRELASKYVVGGKKEKLVFELGISDDLYPYFIKIVSWVVIFVIIGYTLKIISYAYHGSAAALLDVAMIFAEMLLSITFIILGLYVLMSIVSSNPDLKKGFLKIMKDLGLEIRREVERAKKRTEVRIAKPREVTERPKRFEEIEYLQPFPRAIAYSPSILLVFKSFVALFMAYMVFMVSILPFNQLMKFFLYILSTYLILIAVIDLVEYFYEKYTETRSYLADTVKSVLGFMFLPWLLIAAIFTEQIQLIIIPTEYLVKGYFDLLRYGVIITIPQEYLPLAKIIIIVAIIAIIVDGLIAILKYVRTAPKAWSDHLYAV